MKIGILYICTGQYTIFWKDFYLSAQQFFLSGHEIHYFVFTDSDKVYDKDINHNIHIIPHIHLGRPDATLMRFHIFLGVTDQLKRMDYVFFCNANLEIKQSIGEEILPTLEEGIVMTQHPGFYNKKNYQFSYERNSNSSAYINHSEGKYYVAGGFNGGISNSFLEMCEVLSDNIDKDRANNVIALWHDESHINKYILSHNYKLLDPSYLYPEGRDMPFECRILIRDKSKIIPIDSIKGYKQNIFSKIFNTIKRLIIYILKRLKG